MQWYYLNKGEEFGPFEEEDFEMMLAVGKITGNTRVRNEIMEQTFPFRETRIGRELLGEGEEGSVPPTKLHYQAVEAAELGIYASFFVRALARLLDMTVLASIFVIAALYCGAGDDLGLSLEPGHPGFMFTVIGFVTISVMCWTYFTVFIGRFGATPGMMVFNLRVVMAEGGAVTYLRAFLRFGVDWLLIVLFVVPALCSYALVLFTPNCTAIHDIVCKTRVFQQRLKF